MIPVTLHFTEEQYQLLQRHAENTNVTVEQILQESAENKVLSLTAEMQDSIDLAGISLAHLLEEVAQKINSRLGDLPDVSGMSDFSVLQLAQSTMDEAENERLYELQHLDRFLTPDEGLEFARLKEKAYWGQLTKNQALLEAKKRGLFEDE